MLETCRLSPVLVELLEHPGGLTGSELGHADVGALEKLVSIESKYHAGGGGGMKETHVVHEVVDGVDTYIPG